MGTGRDRKALKILILLFTLVNLVLIVLLWQYFDSMGSDLKRWNIEKTEYLLRQGRVPNLVSVIYMKNRILDTLIEVLVFSMAVFGVRIYHTSKEAETKEIEDRNYRFLSRYFAFLAMIVSLYLALTGHLSPGGGFSAGVAGGTAILLLGISAGIDEMERKFERMMVDRIEKIVITFMVILTLLEYRFEIVFGDFGEMLSGGLIPVQSLIIYMKVLAGVWVIVYNFMKHRGIV